MFCINCLLKSTHVTNSRPSKREPRVWRRRHCEACGTTFTTYERPTLDGTDVVTTKAGDKVPFNLGKLTISIFQAFSFNVAKGMDSALYLSESVEQQLAVSRSAEISSSQIAATAYQVLQRFDTAAAAQYAIQQNMITSLRRAGRPSLGAHDRHQQ